MWLSKAVLVVGIIFMSVSPALAEEVKTLRDWFPVDKKWDAFAKSTGYDPRDWQITLTQNFRIRVGNKLLYKVVSVVLDDPGTTRLVDGVAVFADFGNRRDLWAVAVLQVNGEWKKIYLRKSTKTFKISPPKIPLLPPKESI